MWNALEHFLDGGLLSWVRPLLGADAVPWLQAVVASRGLVSLSAEG
jgi:hypothetical protein